MLQASIDLDLGGLVGGREQQRVADREAAGLDPAGEDPALVELVDVLDRQAQRPVALRPARSVNWSSALITVGPWYQGIARERATMLSPSRAEIGMKPIGSTPRLGEIVAVLLGDRAEAVGAVADEVHLVDQHRDLLDAQQMEQVAVAVGLLAHALLGVDQQQRGLAAGRAGDHVLEEFLVARARR